ncbi:MAG: uracil-DNA glycosylase [Lentisphaeraceae bacterium]|nr:uracil-DNA glycosylase [Lentisphaeraceae bacterium]
MANLIDNLIENIKVQISQGNTYVPIEPEVLEELYKDYDTPQISLPTTPHQVQTAQAPTVAAPEPVEAKVIETPKTHYAPIPETKVLEVKEETPVSPKNFEPTPAEEKPAPIQASSADNLSLDELRDQGNTCSSCKLQIGEKRSENTGLNAQARLMIITEPAGTAPEFIADPFAGEAGKLLIKMISAMNLNMDDVYLTMAHRCFGPGARETISQSRPYLEKQIELVNPEVIVIFGGAALNILLNEQSLVKCRGRWLDIGNVPAIATYPPGYLLKKAEAKREAWNDLKQVISRLNL